MEIIGRQPLEVESDFGKTRLRYLWLDAKEIAFLLLLYTIQGTAMGMSESVIFLLQGHVDYSSLGILSLVALPFSLKVCWAPLVDSFYIRRLGRRKSWLVPIQTLCSLLMYFGGTSLGIESWLGSANGGSRLEQPCVICIFLYFTVLYFLMATQDIVVDGWSLTMLHEKNRGMSSTCNAVGQILGFSLSYDLFLILSNPKVSNNWLRVIPSEDPIVTVASYSRIWSYITLFSTVLAFLFHENDVEDFFELDAPQDPLKTYQQLFSLMFSPLIKLLSVILLTCRVPFATTDATISVKLLEAGMTKEQLTSLSPFLLPIKFFSPLMIGWVTSHFCSLNFFLLGWKLRFVMSFAWLALFQISHIVYRHTPVGGSPSKWFYILVFIAISLHTLFTDIMFSSQISLFSHIADPSIGGTYMTYLNTVGNIGIKWPTVFALFTLNYAKHLIGVYGYFLQTFLCLIFGIFWLHWIKPHIQILRKHSHSSWRVLQQSKNNR